MRGHRTTRLSKATAAETYAASQQRIATMLALVKARLQVHAERAGADPMNWGFAGDLAHVETLLADTLVALGADK